MEQIKQTPPTWNDALNAMSAEEKAKWMLSKGRLFDGMAYGYASYFEIKKRKPFDLLYVEKMTELLAIPYDGGKAQEGAET